MYRPTIVIVDSGVQKDHPYLAGDVIQETVFPIGADTCADTADETVLYGHGTAIYGII